MPAKGTPADRLYAWLRDLAPGEIRARAARLRELLRSPWVMVRFEAAQAYVRAGLPAADLREALRTEPSDVVADEICASLAALGDAESVPLLQEVARSHRQWLPRGAAMFALWDLRGRASLPFLRSLRAGERSRGNRASLHVILLAHGEASALPEVLRAISSRVSCVRCRAGLALEEFRPRLHREEILDALRLQLRKEAKFGVIDALIRAMAAMVLDRRGPHPWRGPNEPRRYAYSMTLGNPDPDELRRRALLLRRFLRSPDSLDRQEATFAYIRAKLPLDDVYAALRAETSFCNVEMSCDHLAEVGGAEARSALEGVATEHPQAEIRASAQRALWKHDEAATLPFFRKILRTERNRTLKARLAAALVAHDDGEALPVLLRALTCADATVRRDAAYSVAWHRPKWLRTRVLATLRAQLAKESERSLLIAFERAVEALTARPPDEAT